MNNQKRCWFCHNSVMYLKSIKNKEGYAISMHNICRTCNKDQTARALKKRMSTINSKKRIKSSKKPTPNRLPKALLVGIVSAVLTVWSCNALASYEPNTINYTAQTASSTAPLSAQKPLGRTETLNPVAESIHDKITRYALKYDVDPRQLENIVKCETGATDVNKASTTIRSRYLEGTPRHEKSYGLVQISLRNHPETSYSQAIDPDYALNFLASNWKQHKEWWSCTRILGL